jgi:hypothetical protein
MAETQPAASLLQLMGASCFGLLLGWYLYHINRYRTGEVQLQDLVTLVGVLGGGAILALFPARSDLFGAYGIGLALGFFGYFAVLGVLVWSSESFTSEWFLDGRRKKPVDPWYVPESVRQTVAPMSGGSGGGGINA